MALTDKFEKVAKGENRRSSDIFINSDEGRMFQIQISQVSPDPNQPRKDLGDIEGLKQSIETIGLIEPIIVSKNGEDSYKIISGERRYTAVRDLGFETISAVIRTVEEHHRLELQLIENIQRKDLSAFEEAQSFQKLIAEFGLTQDQVAKRLGKSKAAINQTLRILDLPEAIKEEIQTSEFSSKSLLLEIVKQPVADQHRMWEEAKSGNLTVKKAREQKAEKQNNGKASQKTYQKDIKTKNAMVSIRFKKGSATKSEIIQALKEAIAIMN